MSRYIYAIIPYKSDISVSREEPCICYPVLPELKGVESKYAEDNGKYFYKLLKILILI